MLDLLLQEDVTNDQLIILIDGRKYNSLNKLLTNKPLPKPYNWKTSTQIKSSKQIVIETIGRFKGLESDIVVLWGVDNLDKEADREIFYVATSRAKSRLIIAAIDSTCSYIKTFD